MGKTFDHKFHQRRYMMGNKYRDAYQYYSSGNATKPSYPFKNVDKILTMVKMWKNGKFDTLLVEM